MERILTNNLNRPTVSEEEKAVSRCILALKKSAADHYAASGVPGAATIIEAPRGSEQTAAAKVVSTETAGITPNIISGAYRLIEPWGLTYFATFTGTAEIKDRGIVYLNEAYFDEAYRTSQDDMRLNANSYTFRTSDGTLVYRDAAKSYASVLSGCISSKDIMDKFYCVPFAVLEDGSYVYGTVKSNSMYNIMQNNLKKDSVPETEKQVSRDIIALYEAVMANIEAMG